MARIVVRHDKDPDIEVTLEYVPEGTPGLAQGTHGRCTGCGRPMHWWRLSDALRAVVRHVDAHE